MLKKAWPSEVWPKPVDEAMGWYDYEADDVTYREEMYDEIADLMEELEKSSENEDFDEDFWNDELNEYMAKLKIDEEDTAYDIERIIGYTFVNQNLLRQAFTRRAFALEYGLTGCSEELELIGDSVINSVVTREMITEFSELDIDHTDAPFRSRFDEGELSKIRTKYICKEHLAGRAVVLGLDQYILYGTEDQETESSREDMIEALVGAVAMDCRWDYDTLQRVVETLLGLQFENPDLLLKKDYYDVLNAWHQRHYGTMPGYDVYRHHNGYQAVVESSVLKAYGTGATRSAARSDAAEQAVAQLKKEGRWINLARAEMVPVLSDAVSQLQELYQKKYLEEAAVYEFEKRNRYWSCTCSCGAYMAPGRGDNKAEAKRRAAFVLLCMLYKDSGLMTEDLEAQQKAVWEEMNKYYALSWLMAGQEG